MTTHISMYFHYRASVVVESAIAFECIQVADAEKWDNNNNNHNIRVKNKVHNIEERREWEKKNCCLAVCVCVRECVKKLSKSLLIDVKIWCIQISIATMLCSCHSLPQAHSQETHLTIIVVCYLWLIFAHIMHGLSNMRRCVHMWAWDVRHSDRLIIVVVVRCEFRTEYHTNY